LVNSKKLREESLKLKEMQVCFLANQTLFSEGDRPCFPRETIVARCIY